QIPLQVGRGFPVRPEDGQLPPASRRLTFGLDEEAEAPDARWHGEIQPAEDAVDREALPLRGLVGIPLPGQYLQPVAVIPRCHDQQAEAVLVRRELYLPALPHLQMSFGQPRPVRTRDYPL